MATEIKEILAMRQTNEFEGKVHESIFRSYHILDKVIQMMKRGDSKETIFEMIDYLDGGERVKNIVTL